MTHTLLYYVPGTPAHGTLSWPSYPTNLSNVVYTPDPGYTGPDSFTYTVFDGWLHSAPATMTLTVGTGGGAAPVAQAQTVTVFPLTGGFPIVLKATDAEKQAIGYTYAQPAHGTLSPVSIPSSVQHRAGACHRSAGTINWSPRQPKEVCCRRLAAPQADHYFLINDGPERSVSLSTDYAYRSASDALTGETVPLPGPIVIEDHGGRWVRCAKI